MFSDFDGLVRFLSEDVPWDASDDDAIMARVADAMQEGFQRNSDLVRERIVHVLRNDELLEELLPHADFPHRKRDRYVLFADPQDRFRIRLHRFYPGRVTGRKFGSVHDHKYSACTLILQGAYDERSYSITDRDESTQVARVRLARQHVLSAGMVDVKGMQTAHQVRNNSDDEAMLSLFVRGPSFRAFGDVYDVDTGAFWPYAGAKDTARVGLLTALAGSSDIHAEPEVINFIGNPDRWPERFAGLLAAADPHGRGGSSIPAGDAGRR